MMTREGGKARVTKEGSSRRDTSGSSWSLKVKWNMVEMSVMVVSHTEAAH